MGAVYELPKKRGVPPPLSSTHLPLHRRSNRRITRGSPTSRRRYDQTTTGVSNPRKSRGPTLCSVRRIHPLSDDALLCSLRNKPAAIGRTAHQRLLVWTTTTPLLRPEASQGNTSNKPLWSSPCLRCSLVRWRQSSQRFSTGTTDEDTFPSVHLRHKKDLGSRTPGPLFLQPPHTPSSWKNDPTREQIRRFRRAQKRRG